jgi:hypothetical protein
MNANRDYQPTPAKSNRSRTHIKGVPCCRNVYLTAKAIRLDFTYAVAMELDIVLCYDEVVQPPAPPTFARNLQGVSRS